MSENGTALAQRQTERTTAMERSNIGKTGIQLASFAELWAFANCVSRSGLAPKGIDRAESIVIALQMGFEVGLPPMAALQNIAVINGRPSLWGDAQLAVVRATGELEAFSEGETDNRLDAIFREMCLTEDPNDRKRLVKELSIGQASLKVDAEDFGVTVYVKRRGFDGGFSRFTVADARKAQLWGKGGPWSQYPKRMLKFRARSFGLRDQFGDALRGLLSSEEAQDIEPVGTYQVQRTDNGGLSDLNQKIRESQINGDAMPRQDADPGDNAHAVEADAARQQSIEDNRAENREATPEPVKTPSEPVNAAPVESPKPEKTSEPSREPENREQGDANPAPREFKSFPEFIAAAEVIAKTQNVTSDVFEAAMKSLRTNRHSKVVSARSSEGIPARTQVYAAMEAGAFNWKTATIDD